MQVVLGFFMMGQAGPCVPPSPGGAGSPGNKEADAATAAAANQILVQALDGGSSKSEAINSLVQKLKSEPNVVVAMADEDGQTAWALFNSGLEYVYEVIDEDEELVQFQAPQVTAKAAAAFKSNVLGVGKEKDPSVNTAQLGLASTYILPGNNKAVLANSLYKTRSLQDVRKPLKPLLEACGYEVKVVDADLEFFKSMSKYSVIFIEAHGSLRNDVEQAWDSIANTLYNTSQMGNRPFCGLKGGEVVLQTSTEVTQELKDQYKEDLECGRLKIRRPTVRRKGQPTVTYKFFAVTPNFVRHYDKGTFPANALMCLSSCRSFSADGSPWADLLYEKSYGSIVVGWDYRVHYGISARAMLHLFQFMAGTNEQFAITEIDQTTGAKTIYPLLFKTDAPVLPQTVNMAMDGLAGQSFERDPVTGARLTGSGDTLYGWSQLMLAPAIEGFETLGDGKVRLTGRSKDGAELRFADGGVFNIGNISNGEWSFSVPAGYFGSMSLYQENRKCPPRDLLRWNPVVVKIRPASTTTAFGTCDFLVTYRLCARAVAAGNRWGRSVWDKPDFAFDAVWDPDASVVTWSVNGKATVPDDLFGPSTCTWSGGNSRSFNEVSVSAGDTGGLVSYDGKTAYLSVEPPFGLAYTISCSGAFPPDYACGVYGSIISVEVNLGSDWSILAGSETDLLGQHVIEWQACTPKPAFASDRLPR
jgi:hypothetical protein